MKNKLISTENIAELLTPGASEFHADKSMIFTSGAKDFLRSKKINLVFGKNSAGNGVTPQSASSCHSSCRTGENNLRPVVEKIVSVLRNDLQVKNAAKVERVTQQVLARLSKR